MRHDHGSAEIRKAANWLVAIQNSDGGWGEDGTSYKLDYRGHEPASSTSSQTAWALLGLMASGDIDHPAVARGVHIRKRRPRMAFGPKNDTPRPVFPAFFTCAITDIENSFRYGRSRVIAI